jgi:glyoxylase-like metal-dependent hydrolase (beta-lactamase superfamily II)
VPPSRGPVFGARPGLPPQLSDRERALLAEVRAGVPDVRAVPAAVDRELDDGDLIDLGGEPAVAIAVPGHTMGSVAYHLPDSRVLFAGTRSRGRDGEVIPGVFNVDPELAAESFRRQAALTSTSPVSATATRWSQGFRAPGRRPGRSRRSRPRRPDPAPTGRRTRR